MAGSATEDESIQSLVLAGLVLMAGSFWAASAIGTKPRRTLGAVAGILGGAVVLAAGLMQWDAPHAKAKDLVIGLAILGGALATAAFALLVAKRALHVAPWLLVGGVFAIGAACVGGWNVLGSIPLSAREAANAYVGRPFGAGITWGGGLFVGGLVFLAVGHACQTISRRAEATALVGRAGGAFAGLGAALCAWAILEWSSLIGNDPLTMLSSRIGMAAAYLGLTAGLLACIGQIFMLSRDRRRSPSSPTAL